MDLITRKELAQLATELVGVKISTDAIRRNEGKWGLKRKRSVGRSICYDSDAAANKLKEYFELE